LKPSFNDYELIYYYLLGSQDAFVYLSHKYRGIIIAQSQMYQKKCQGIGYTQDDIISEAYFLLHECVYSYNPNQKAKFSTYFVSCLRMRIFALLRNENTHRKITLSMCCSLDTTCIETGESHYSIISDGSLPLSERVIQHHEFNSLAQTLKGSLSYLERKIFVLHSEGYKYDDIALILKIPKKKVDNTLYKCKKIVKAFKEDYNS